MPPSATQLEASLAQLTLSAISSGSPLGGVLAGVGLNGCSTNPAFGGTLSQTMLSGER